MKRLASSPTQRRGYGAQVPARSGFRRILYRKDWTLWIAATLLLSVLGGFAWHLLDEALVSVIVRVSPGREECLRWVAHLRAAGHRVWVEEDRDLAATRRELGIPDELAACHTAVTVRNNRYIVEGHVPADVIGRLLKEQPAIRGVAVPGSPVGAPGLEGPEPKPYNIYSFSADGRITLLERRVPSLSTEASSAKRVPAVWTYTAIVAGIVALAGAVAALLGVFSRLGIVEREFGPFVYAFRAVRGATEGVRVSPQIRADLTRDGVTDLQPLTVVSSGPHDEPANKVGWVAPVRFRNQVERMQMEAHTEHLPVRRCMLIDYARIGVLGNSVGLWRARRAFARHRVTHGYSDGEIYVQRLEHTTLFAQPIRRASPKHRSSRSA